MAQQLKNANARLDDNNHQMELLTEQIRLTNQRHFGKKAESTIEEVTISSYRRSKTKGKREADLDGLPAKIFEHKPCSNAGFYDWWYYFVNLSLTK